MSRPVGSRLYGRSWTALRSGWPSVARDTLARAGRDNLLHIAAGIGFYCFLALVPALGALVLTYGLVADPAAMTRHITELSRVLPPEATQLIADQLAMIVTTAKNKTGFGLLLALGLALFSARGAAGAVMTGLNIAYDCDEQRGFIHTSLIALGITVFGVVLAALLVGAVSVIIYAMQSLALPDAARPLVQVATYAAMTLLLAAGAAALFYVAPDHKQRHYVWLTPGSVFAAVVWLVATLGFQFYVSRFGDYNATYGALGAVIVMLTWLYLSAAVLLLGGVFNHTLDLCCASADDASDAAHTLSRPS